MDFCNYTWNIMNLSLFVTFDTMLRLQEPSEGIRGYIRIFLQKLDFFVGFRADWESTNFKPIACVSFIYNFYADEETVDEGIMKIVFSE